MDRGKIAKILDEEIKQRNQSKIWTLFTIFNQLISIEKYIQDIQISFANVAFVFCMAALAISEY